MTEDMFAQKGWICPKCGRVLAPSTMYCLWCCSDKKESITTTGTSIPKWNTTPIKVGSGMIDSNGTGRSYFVETSSISRDSHEIAKTENNSEKPNNCEHITEDGVTCAKYPACDDCLDNPLNKVKGSERLLKGKDEPQTYVINPQEPTNDDKCFECDDFFTCGGQCNKIETEPTGYNLSPVEDEPQTERSSE